MSNRCFSSPDITTNNLDAETLDHKTVKMAAIRLTVPLRYIKILNPDRATTGKMQYPKTLDTDMKVILPSLLINVKRIYIRKQDVTAKP